MPTSSARRRKPEFQKAHDALELRVAERTGALVQANRELQSQIAERQLAEERAARHQEEKRKIEEQLLRSQRMDSIGHWRAGSPTI